jgi:hypothetical protein
MNHGAKVCPQCTHVQSALSKRPQSVANAIRAMGKTEELLSALIPAGGGIAVKMTADFLQEISGIVGYEGEDPGELVASVRRRVLTCASCDSEDVLHEIREVVGYVPEQGDKGLADAVRDAITSPVPQCTYCIGKRDDLLRACGLEMDDTDDGEGWDVAVAAAIQEIAKLQDRKYFAVQAGDELNAKLQDALGKLAVANGKIGELDAKCDRLEAEAAAYEAENIRLREQRPESIGLLDVALAVIREEPVPAGKIAQLIEAARRAA